MKVHEVIAALQNYPMDMDVFCMSEASEWGFSSELGESVEEVYCVERHVNSIENFDSPFTGEPSVKIC